jgi:hypothetical protein
MFDFVQPFKGSKEELEPFAIDGRDPVLAAVVCKGEAYAGSWGFSFFSAETHAEMLSKEKRLDASPMTYIVGDDSGGCQILTVEQVSKQWGSDSPQYAEATRHGTDHLAVCGSYYEGLETGSVTVDRRLEPPSRWFRLMCYESGDDFALQESYEIYSLSNDYIGWANKLEDKVVAFRIMPNEAYDVPIYEKTQLFFIDADILRLADVDESLGKDSREAQLMREHSTLMAVRTRDGKVHRHEMNAQNVRR